MAAPRRPSQSSIAYSDHLGPSLWASPPPSVKAESPRQDQSAAFLVSPQDLDTGAGSHLHNAPRKPRKKARTAEEKAQRQQERILRNRLAAQTSRERKRKYIEDLEGMRDSLRSENSQLVKRVRSLEGENKELMSRLESMAGQIEDLKATVSCYDSPYQRSTGYRPLTPQARSPPPSQPQYLPVASVQHPQQIQWTTSQAYIPDTTTILNMSHPAVMSDPQSLLRPACILRISPVIPIWLQYLTTIQFLIITIKTLMTIAIWTTFSAMNPKTSSIRLTYQTCAQTAVLSIQASLGRLPRRDLFRSFADNSGSTGRKSSSKSWLKLLRVFRSCLISSDSMGFVGT